ncbi:nucleobase-ascorbate transporter [Trifolium repens]|nr:nucleobase-ascorbate transporter [Trifolium repens]
MAITRSFFIQSRRAIRRNLRLEKTDQIVNFPGKHGFLNVLEAFAMMAASLVSLFEFTGTSYAAARYGSATPVSPYIISHGASWVVRFNISI